MVRQRLYKIFIVHVAEEGGFQACQLVYGTYRYVSTPSIRFYGLQTRLTANRKYVTSLCPVNLALLVSIDLLSLNVSMSVHLRFQRLGDS
jgi:hypothetical protein